MSYEENIMKIWTGCRKTDVLRQAMLFLCRSAINYKYKFIPHAKQAQHFFSNSEFFIAKIKIIL
jgi:hypothetical protein